MRTVADDSTLRGFVAAISLGFLVASCDSTSDSASWTASSVIIDQSPAGIYAGTFRSTATTGPQSLSVTGIVSEEFRIHLLAQSSQYGGIVSVEGDALTGTMTEYIGTRARWFGFDGVRSITLDGIVSEQEGIAGDYSGDDAGIFGLDYSDRYELPSALVRVSGVWAFNSSASAGLVYNVTFDIDPTGQLFGSDTDGCVYSGEIGIIDRRFNAYSVTLAVSSCQLVDGNYTGLAFRNSVQGLESLWMFVDNGRYAFSTKFSQ